MQWQITPDKYLTVEQIESLFSRLETLSRTGLQKWIKCWAVTHFTFATGARVSEVAHVQHQHLTLDGSEPKIHIVNGKGNRSRFIPLNERLRQHLIEYSEWKASILQSCSPESYLFQSKCSDRYSISGLQGLFKLGLRELGLDEKYSFHSARHTFATHHYSNHRNILMTSRLLGHASVVTTMVYSHSNFKDMLQSTQNIYRRR
jgi:site-specific recombinase XerD